MQPINAIVIVDRSIVCTSIIVISIGMVDAVSPELTINGLPWRIFASHEVLGAACAGHVEDRIRDLAHIWLAMTAAGFSRRNQRFDILRFSVGDVAGESWYNALVQSEPAESF